MTKLYFHTKHQLIVAALLTLPFHGSAQVRKDSIEVQHIKDVVITGQYSPNDPARSVQKIKIIGRQKIEAMNAQNLRDVLTNELNVRLESDPILGSSLSVGGMTGRNVKILVDGVPVIGKLEGNVDVSQINLNNIERIEIVEGPMAVNYGTDALGGAINLITKKELKKTWEGGIKGYYETTGVYNLSGRAGFTKKKHTVTLNAGRNFFDGWRQDEKISFDYSPRLADSSRAMTSRPKEQYFSNFQYIYKAGKNTTINYKLDYFNELITNRGVPGINGQYALDEYYRTKRLDNAVFINTKVRNGGLNILAAYNDYKRVKNAYNNYLVTLDETLVGADGSQDTSKYRSFNTRGTYTNAIGSKLNYEGGYDINLQNGTGRRIVGKTRYIGDYALYASTEYKPVEVLTIRPGIRYSYNTAFNAPFIPSLSVAYKPGRHITLRGSYSKGFRAPDLKELYFDFTDVNHDIKGNTNLKPEYSDNYNASAVYVNLFGDVLFKADVSTFYNDIRDGISLAWIGPSAQQYMYVNVSRFLSHGVQTNFDITVSNLKISVGASYIGRYNDLSEVDGNLKKYLYAPELRGSVTYNVPKQGVSMSVFYKYTGALPMVVADPQTGILGVITNKGYSMADINLNKSIIKNKLQIGIGCKNLFNVTTVRGGAVNDMGIAHSGGGSMILGNGRLYLLKLDHNF